SPGDVEVGAAVSGESLELSASGWSAAPSNVAFEVLSPSGAGRWYQAREQGDGSWAVEAPAFSDMGEVGTYSVRAWATIDGVALRTAETSAAFSAGEISVSAEVSGGSLELSASGWLVPSRNVAFEVLSPSGAGRWYQAREQGDGSWAATVDAGADFGEWGEYTVNAWASYGQDTRVYGNSPTVVIEKVSLIYSINTPHGSVMSGSDGLQASSWNGSYVENVCGITVSIQESPIEGSISYQGYVPGNGWTAVGTDGSLSGSNSSSSVFSAVKISLSGDISNYCDIWYSIYVEDFGSLGWTKNGSITGSTNLPLKVQAISIVARPKGSAAPGSTANSLLTSYPYIGYQNPLQYYQVSNKSVTVPHLGEGTFGYRTESRIPYNATREDCVNAMIQRAYEYMGTQYVWDYACAPGVGVDCAGLVLQCLYATGMDLSPMNPWDHYYLGLSGGWHSAYANYMWTNGRFQHVSLSQRQRGDIISWNGHVAIYIGNDQVIEAAPPRVRISNLWYLGTPRGVLRPFV
ncbi:NlpC/P60 family protein, partial [uncultured Enorma sp.]|uniref:NlpC/P60 family protein n=1 Tax=uncultured Enorma sp. TaxID=1714346 RepID=UPI002593A109